MIPFLFRPDATEFYNEGIGAMVDAASCRITEERNGTYELQMQYPVSGNLFQYISVDCIIVAKPNTSKESINQAFRIYKITKPVSGLVTINAEHISYQLSNIIVNPFYSTQASDALNKIRDNSISENPFTFYTDIDDLAFGEVQFDVPTSARALLGGIDYSVLDAFGGEYEFNNFNVYLFKNRGLDRGVTIEYGKNLVGFKLEEKLNGIATGALCVWTEFDEDGNVLNQVYGDLERAYTHLSYSRDVVVDCSSEFDEVPTREQLNEKAQEFLLKSKNDMYISATVEFVNLGDTEEYKQFKHLEEVNICDTITVKHPIYGFSAKTKVVKTVYDVIAERYEKIQVANIDRVAYSMKMKKE